MSNTINQKAQDFLGSEQGQKFGSQIKQATGVDVSSYAAGNGHSNYEGFGANDSTASGGFGLNAGGSSFSRANQMGTSDVTSTGSYDNDNNTPGGVKTGASTPGYRHDNEDGVDVNDRSQFRGQNLSFTSSKKDDDEPEI